MKSVLKLFSKLAILGIDIYKKCVSPYLPPTCRFTPTCSVYARQAFCKYSFFKALLLSITRILKCHPFHPGGNDPLP